LAVVIAQLATVGHGRAALGEAASRILQRIAETLHRSEAANRAAIPACDYSSISSNIFSELSNWPFVSLKMVGESFTELLYLAILGSAFNGCIRQIRRPGASSNVLPCGCRRRYDLPQLGMLATGALHRAPQLLHGAHRHHLRGLPGHEAFGVRRSNVARRSGSSSLLL
jgi:hypothetical protein